MKNIVLTVPPTIWKYLRRNFYFYWRIVQWSRNQYIPEFVEKYNKTKKKFANINNPALSMQKICLLEKSFFQNQKLHKCYTFTKIFFPIFYNSSILLVQFRFLLSSFDLTSTILHYPPTLNQINSPHKNISNVITLHKLIVIPNDKLTSQLRSSQTDKTSKQKKEFEILLNAAISYQIARIRRIEESQDLIARVFYQLLPLCLSS